MIGVMFLIAVDSIVEGMSPYNTDEYAANILGMNPFTLRRAPVCDQWRAVSALRIVAGMDLLVRPQRPHRISCLRMGALRP